MDALMAALVAAACAQLGDRTAWIAAILADRLRMPVLVIAMAALAIVAVASAATIAGIMLAPRLTPEAKQLLFALALIAQGAAALFPTKPPRDLLRWGSGGVSGFAGLMLTALQGGVPFIVLAIAARSTMPWLATVGATIGSIAVIVPAAVQGERGWLALPLRPARLTIGLLFLLAGASIGIAAIGLV